MSTHYGTLVAANEFFGNRLFSYDWDLSSTENRTKALCHATQLIDMFDYLGSKYAVQTVYDSTDGCPTEDQLQAAELSQPLQFPRGNSNVVPVEIERATYLIAQAL